MFDRIPEPELMEDLTQARAYSEADFSEPHNMFIDRFRQEFSDHMMNGLVLEPGCGGADISVRFARAFPECQIHALDGAEAMIDCAEERISQENLENRITLIHDRIPLSDSSVSRYQAIISNSLLHHLADPDSLWETIRAQLADNGLVFIMDLMRPDSKEQARLFVDQYASREPVILQHDFYHSLLAAYRPFEVQEQLQKNKLGNLNVSVISDRHLLVSGMI